MFLPTAPQELVALPQLLLQGLDLAGTLLRARALSAKLVLACAELALQR